VPLPNAIDARQLIELYYGTRITTVPRESDVTVGTTAAKLGTRANTRTAIAISNGGAASIAVGFSNAVTSSTGIIVVSNGFLFLNWLEDQEIVNLELWAISGSSGNGVHVVEYELSGL
jgi:hypothetical protein